MVEEYNQFLSYILDNDLEDVYDLKPILNGDDIKKTFNAKPGPWMSKATALVIEWQLLHPESDREAALEEITRRREELGLEVEM